MMVNASEIELARKKIHANKTKQNVSAILGSFGVHDLFPVIFVYSLLRSIVMLLLLLQSMVAIVAGGVSILTR